MAGGAGAGASGFNRNTEMIYTFRLVSDEVDNFMREIQIDADASFLALRNAICDAVGYDKQQMGSFYLCDDGWEKSREITLEDMGNDMSEEVYLMDESTISDFVEDEGQRLIYTFDYLTDRSFFMELKSTQPGKHLSEPICSRKQGNPPAEAVDLDEFDAKIDATAARNAAADPMDLDDDFYGSTDYNDDELDLSSLDDLDLSE